jgi:hypothetical protein
MLMMKGRLLLPKLKKSNIVSSSFPRYHRPHSSAPAARGCSPSFKEGVREARGSCIEKKKKSLWRITGTLFSTTPAYGHPFYIEGEFCPFVTSWNTATRWRLRLLFLITRQS